MGGQVPRESTGKTTRKKSFSREKDGGRGKETNDRNIKKGGTKKRERRERGGKKKIRVRKRNARLCGGKMGR